MAQNQIFIFLTICYLFGATLADATPQISNNDKVDSEAKKVTTSAAAANNSEAVSASAQAPKSITSFNPLVVAHNITAPPKCVCDGALLPRLGDNGKAVEICPECKCQHVARNTTLIKVVVIIVIWIISILVIYMLFLMCLDPLLNKRVKANYQEHTNEDDDTVSTPPISASTNQELSSRANVLNRVGHQQNKWKRQVREQRRHIYDRRTMLN